MTKMMRTIGLKSPKKVNQKIMLTVKKEMNLFSKMEQNTRDNGRIASGMG
jgi:hypothetical protein